MESDKNGGPVFLKAWREAADLTQAELAEKVGTNANMIGYLESGERGMTVKWLRKLGPALGVHPWAIVAAPPETDDPGAEVVDIWDRIPFEERGKAKSILEIMAKKTG